jgi:Leucine-rich repeat (LRR) protein
MATKGVEYCNIVDKEKSLIEYCIDINVNKQNKFIPFTGHQIQAPDCLLEVKKNLLVVVMNTNYITEIKQFIDNNSLKAIYLNGHGVII